MKTLIPLCLALCLIASCAKADVTSPSASLETKKSDQGEISYPVLWALKDAAINKAVNDEIAKEAASWSCEESGDNISFNATSEVRYIKENILSYTTNFDYYCGGAYPDIHMETRNYDLTTGKLITTESILNDDFTGEKLSAFLIKNHKNEEEDCEGAYEDRTWNFYVTEDDIVFIPEMPHATQICAVEFKIPLSKIKAHLRPDTFLSREGR